MVEGGGVCWDEEEGIPVGVIMMRRSVWCCVQAGLGEGVFFGVGWELALIGYERWFID